MLLNTFPPKYVVLAVIGFTVAYSGNAASAELRCPLPQRPVASLDEAIALVKEAVPVYKLTPIANECLTIGTWAGVEQPKDGYHVDIREKHGAQCEGDPMTGPRIFSINVRKDGRMSTDAYLPVDGWLKPLICPKKKKSVRKK